MAKDKHLNLFYSYAQGKLDSDSQRILENNLTRALIITLSHSYKFREMFFALITGNIKKKITFSNIFDEEKAKANFYYDLQGFNGFDWIVDKSTIKWIIVKISPLQAPDNINYENLNVFYDSIYDNMFESKKNDYIKTLKELIENEEKKEGTEKDERYLNELIVCLDFIVRDGLPDAWIYDKSKNIGICIENKVYGYCTRSQINRHKKYINKKIKSVDINDIEEVEITWETINNNLNTYKISNNNKIDNYILTNFKEYLKMTNTVLDLSFIVKEGEGYEKIEARKQFKLFLAKLDSKISSLNLNLGRGEKPLDKIWDYYGVLNHKNEPKKNPHYSISMGADHASIYLTTNNKKQINNLIKNEKLTNYIEKILNPGNINFRSRYYIDLINYKLIDYKKGMLKGETFESFKFSVNFSTLNNDKKNITTIFQAMDSLLPFSKQFDFGIRIDYPSVNKIKRDSKGFQLRLENEKLFNDYNLLIYIYLEFIKDTIEIYNEIELIK